MNFLLKDGSRVKLPRFVREEDKAFWANEDFTNEQHHTSYDAVSSSQLAYILKSPYSFLEHTKRHQNGENAKTDAMEFGTIAHLMVLEPTEIRRRVVLSPPFDFRKTEDKKAFDVFKAQQHPDAVIFRQNSKEEFPVYERLMGVLNALLSHEKAKDIFKEGIAERTGFFKDERTGLWCRIRPDWMSTAIVGGFLVDFKTCRDSSYNAFRKQSEQLQYPMKLIMYREGYKAINGEYPRVAAWVCVESQFPFEVAVYTIDEALITYAEQRYHYAMDLLAECLERGEFPQRQRSAETMVPSDYAMNEVLPDITEIWNEV
jgi:hypothetical protein